MKKFLLFIKDLWNSDPLISAYDLLFHKVIAIFAFVI